MRHVQCAVGAPIEAIEKLVAIFQAEASQDDLLFIGFVVAVGVFEEQQVRSLADVNAAIAERQSGGKVQSIGEDRDFIRAAVVIGVFENFHLVTAFFARFGAERIFVKFKNP